MPRRSPGRVLPQTEGHRHRVLVVQRLRPQGQGTVRRLPGGRPNLHGCLGDQLPLPVETDHAVKLRRVGEQVPVGDSNSAVIYLDPQALIQVLHLLHLGGRGAVVSIHQAVPAELVVRGPVVKVPAVGQKGPAVPVPLGDGLVDVVPDEATLVGGDLLRQVGVPLLAAEGVAHGVAVLAADGGPGAVLRQHVPDPLGRKIHAAEDVGGLRVPGIVDDALIVDGAAVHPVKIPAGGQEILSAGGLVAQGPDQHRRVVLVPLVHGLRPAEDHGLPAGIVPGDVLLPPDLPHVHEPPGAVGLKVHLVDDIQPVSVAQAVEGGLVGVVAGADGVDVAALHGDHIPLHLILCETAAPGGGELVAVHPVEDDPLPVEQHQPVTDLEPAEAHRFGDGLRGNPVLIPDGDLQAVEMRLLRAPQLRPLHRQGDVLQPGILGHQPLPVVEAAEAGGGPLGPGADMEHTPGEAVVQLRGELQVPDVGGWNGKQVHLPEQAGEAEEVLVLAPAGAGPLEHLDRQLVLPRRQVGGQVELRGGEAVLPVAHILAVAPHRQAALRPLEADIDGPPPPGLRQGEILDIAAHRVVPGGDLSRPQVLPAVPGVLDVDVLGRAVTLHLDVGGDGDGGPAPAVHLRGEKVRDRPGVVLRVVEVPEAVEAQPRRRPVRQGIPVVGVGRQSVLLKELRLLGGLVVKSTHECPPFRRCPRRENLYNALFAAIVPYLSAIRYRGVGPPALFFPKNLLGRFDSAPVSG